MGRILHIIAGVAVATVGAPAAVAGAIPASDTTPPPAPWATVNVCDTTGFPDGVGVRASMPGQGDPAVRMDLRIRLQYRRTPPGETPQQWPAVKGADSGWVSAGTGERKSGEAGQTFTVTPPRPGRAYVLRGVVAFRWRDADGLVLRSAIRLTRGAHPGTMGADPEDFSAAICTVR